MFRWLRERRERREELESKRRRQELADMIKAAIMLSALLGEIFSEPDEAKQEREAEPVA